EATPHGSVIDETFRRAGEQRVTQVFVQFVELAIVKGREEIGITIVDQFSAIESERSGLVSVPLKDSVEVTAYLQWHAHRPRPRSVDDLLEALRSSAAAAGCRVPSL